MGGCLARLMSDMDANAPQSKCLQLAGNLIETGMFDVQIPLHEWQNSGQLPEAKRLVALGCVDAVAEL